MTTLACIAQRLVVARPGAMARASAVLWPLALACAVALQPGNTQAATNLADQPVFSTGGVAGNLVLDLSVEFPTAVGAAYADGNYVPANTYLGYFDPARCYLFKFVDLETASNKSHFAPAALATGHTCTGVNDHLWSGNYMNWATTQTIDPFRSVLTGGYRVVDTASTTLLEKAYASGQGGTGNFPVKTVTSAADVAGATPFTITGLTPFGTQSYVAGWQHTVVFTNDLFYGPFLGTYFNTTDLDYSGARPVLTRQEDVNFVWTLLSPQLGVVNVAPFSARWVNASTVPTTGTYQFRLIHDDGVRLWVNGTLVIDNWGAFGITTSANIALVAGNQLNVRLEYFQGGGPGQIQLLWKAPGQFLYSLYSPGTYTQLPVRVKVCDPSAPGGVESNCKAYPNGNYKPEGLMQQYAQRLRYGVFGYLNDSSLARDGAVLRAKQKFIGLTYPVPNAADQGNSAAEWDGSTGVQLTNPDAADASATSSALGITVSNSGALNYINKFGEITRSSYKTYDPVGELYYASLRYYQNLGNVPSWSSMTGADTATRTVYADGFPVITAWPDPIQYSCQRNFVLGIGDVNSHADKNVPGSTDSSNEPAMPAAVSADTSVNAVTATNKVGDMQGISNLASRRNYPDCCTSNSAFMAGLAYDANTRDIRPDLANVEGTIGQTVQTFWVDVLEGGYKANNQFYLAAKYGGFKVPTGFAPYSAGTTALQDSWWRSNTDTVGSQPRPDNYFPANRPDLMVSGLTKAFAQIAAQLTPYTTAFASALPQVAAANAATYAAQYDGGTWTGEIAANTSAFDASGNPVVTNIWLFSNTLAAQIAVTNTANGWDTNRRVITFNTATKAGVRFRSASISTAQASLLNTVYRGGDSADYLNYLRGDPTQEETSAVTGSSHAYRARSKVVGDIVNAKARVVGPPSAPFSAAANPGYASFKTAYAGRTTMVYAGSNAGMLHAVDGSTTGATAGREVFAYVPGALYQGPTNTPVVNGLQSVGDPDYTHHYMVDGPQATFDIDFNRTSGASGSPDWRTVLVGALGKGGKSYYAIDVTDPSAFTANASNSVNEANAAAKVLWEFSDPKLGYTYGEPAAVKTKKYGWVLVFGSGYNNSDGQGYFFIVNPRTGVLLEPPIATGQGTVANDAGLAQVQAFVLDRTDNTADAIYAGDLLGNLWRLDVGGTGATPAPVQLALLADSANAPLPITSRPLVVVQPGTNKRFVTVGTGRLLASSDVAGTQSQAFFAIIDGTSSAPGTAATRPAAASLPLRKSNLRQLTDLTQPVTIDPATQAGWWFDLGASAGTSWRTITDSTSFNGIVAFSSMVPSGDACNASGNSRVYAIDLGTGQSRLTSGTTTVSYLTTLTGVVGDLRFFSVNGTARLIAGNDKGQVKSMPGKWTTTQRARQLNWRELPLAD